MQSEDSPAARRLYLRAFPGQALILGARQSFDPGHHSYAAFNKLEEQLRAELRESPATDEIFALLSAGYWGDAGQIVLRVRGPQADLLYLDNPARYYLRRLADDEFRNIRDFVESNRIDNLGPLTPAAYDGMQYEYVHLTRIGGRRVFMNNPGVSGSGGSAYDRLCKAFMDLLGSAPMRVQYRVAEKLPEFEVLVADSRFAVSNVWAQGSDLRVQIVHFGGPRRPPTVFVKDADARIAVNAERTGRAEWMSLRNGAMKRAAAPPLFPAEDPQEVVPRAFKWERLHQPAAWSLMGNGVTYRVGEFNDKEGFWRFAAGESPRLLREKQLAFPVLTSDAKWAFLAESTGTWAEPSWIVRLHLKTGKATRVKIPAADTLTPISYLANRNAVLAIRSHDHAVTATTKVTGPQAPEFWLINPETARAEIARGEFGPLQDLGPRALQPAQTAGRFWAAISRSESGTDIGLYDPSRFVFMPVLAVPGLIFGSQQMWIDENAAKVYVVYNHHLVSFALPQRR